MAELNDESVRSPKAQRLYSELDSSKLGLRGAQPLVDFVRGIDDPSLGETSEVSPALREEVRRSEDVEYDIESEEATPYARQQSGHAFRIKDGVLIPSGRGGTERLEAAIYRRRRKDV